jgi:hypothetical protein
MNGYGEPAYGLQPGPDSAGRGNDGGRDRGRARNGRVSSHEVAGHSARSGHHGAGSRGREDVRDRQRASVPGDRETDRGDSDASLRLRAEPPAQPRTRPGRSKRSDDSADWPSTEWDKLSDVDYWAELASDKPLTTTAQLAAAPRPAQAGLERDAQAGADRGAITGHRAAGSVGPGSDRDPAPPTREHPQLAAAPVVVPPPAPAQPRPIATPGYQPDDPTIDQSGDARRGRRWIAGSLDDDPLTSPSFPRVRADDSRSFRSSRAGGPVGSPEAAQNAPTQQFASYQSPAAQYGPPASAAAERGPRPAYPDSYPAGSGSHSRPPSGAVRAAEGTSSAAGTVPSPAGNPYGSYVGSPPSDGFSSRSAPDLNGRPSAPYPATGDLDSRASAPYPATGDLNSRASAPYPPTQELSRHRGASYPPAGDLDARGREWYPQSADSALTRDGNEGTVPGTGRFEAPGTGRHGGDGPYYPAGYLPGGYPAARPGQDGYLPPAGYPGTTPPASHTQDPYAPDGYGRRPRY